MIFISRYVCVLEWDIMCASDIWYYCWWWKPDVLQSDGSNESRPSQRIVKICTMRTHTHISSRYITKTHYTKIDLWIYSQLYLNELDCNVHKYQCTFWLIIPYYYLYIINNIQNEYNPLKMFYIEPVANKVQQCYFFRVTFIDFSFWQSKIRDTS